MGRTVNILEDITDKVTTVEFTDSDGEFYQITQIGDNGNLLKLNRLDCEEDFVESVIFMKRDIDKLIALFQAAKHYNI